MRADIEAAWEHHRAQWPLEASVYPLNARFHFWAGFTAAEAAISSPQSHLTAADFAALWERETEGDT